MGDQVATTWAAANAVNQGLPVYMYTGLLSCQALLVRVGQARPAPAALLPLTAAMYSMFACACNWTCPAAQWRPAHLQYWLHGAHYKGK